jgi:hypothetical protein
MPFVPIFAHAVGPLPDHEELMLLWPVVVMLLIITIVVITVIDESGVLGRLDREVEVGVSLAAVAAGLSFGAAAIHLSVIESHIDRGFFVASFFLLSGWFQMLWPVVYLLRRSRWVAITGAAVNAGIVVLYVISRTVGLPFGLTDGPEAVGFVDLVATIMESVIVVMLMPAILPRFRAATHRPMPLKDALILGSFSTVMVAVIGGYALLGPAFS